MNDSVPPNVVKVRTRYYRVPLATYEEFVIRINRQYALLKNILPQALPNVLPELPMFTGPTPYGLAVSYMRSDPNFIPHTHGGFTEVSIITDTGRQIIGTANCSMLDQFSFKRGRKIALGRALSILRKTSV